MQADGSPGPLGPIQPRPVEIGISASQLIATAFLGSTAGRLAHAARLLAERILVHPDTILGVTLDATLLPAGLGATALAPLMRAGHVDWMAVSGTNLYYDTLVALRKPFYARVPCEGDFRDCGGDMHVRGTDVAATDAALREMLATPEFQGLMGTAQLNHHLGHQLRAREKNLGVEHPSLLSTAAELGVPIFNPSPVDNPLGSVTAGLALLGNRLSVDPSIDLNEAAAVLNGAACRRARCAVWCLGRGSAAGFMLEAPRHLQAIFGPEERLRYDVRIRMAGRAHELPDTPWLGPRGAAVTPRAEEELDRDDFALSADLSVSLPLLASYVLDRVAPRPHKRLYDRRDELLDQLRRDRLAATLRRT